MLTLRRPDTKVMLTAVYLYTVICILGLQLVRDITSGKLNGDKVGSTSVTLLPSSIGSGTFAADTQTAG